MKIFYPNGLMTVIILIGISSRSKEAKTRQEAISRILIDVKAGVEHLYDKLQHLKAPKSQTPLAQLQPTSDEFVLDVLGKK